MLGKRAGGRAVGIEGIQPVLSGVSIYQALKDDLIQQRRSGKKPSAVRVNPEQLKLIEGNFGVEHRDGKMFLEGVELLEDKTVGFEMYNLEYPI